MREFGSKQYFIRRYWENVKVRKALSNLSAKDAVVYSGRGYVQITGRSNYTHLSSVIGVDIIQNPDKALEPHISYAILSHGMRKGLFTGRKLSQFFSLNESQWINARRIINGLDQAERIADYAKKFYSIIQ